jgi:AcrR family transcriptional regulator
VRCLQVPSANEGQSVTSGSTRHIGAPGTVDSELMVIHIPQGARETRPEARISEPFESQGERRRAQLVAIAAQVFRAEGSDAVTHAAVSERAGVGRTAVYKYFPTRDHLLSAIVAAYDRIWAPHIPADAAIEGFAALRGATPRRIPPVTRRLLDAVWDSENWTEPRLELRLATAALQRDHEFLARFATVEPELAAKRERMFTDPLIQLGLTETEIAIVTDAIFAAEYHATKAALDGLVDREAAIRLSYRMSVAVLRAYVD